MDKIDLLGLTFLGTKCIDIFQSLATTFQNMTRGNPEKTHTYYAHNTREKNSTGVNLAKRTAVINLNNKQFLFLTPHNVLFPRLFHKFVGCNQEVPLNNI